MCEGEKCIQYRSGKLQKELKERNITKRGDIQLTIRRKNRKR